MLSIAMIALIAGLMFIYAAFHPDKQLLTAGKILAARIRIGLLGTIMVLSVSVGYLLPVEIGRGLQRMADSQAARQSALNERKMASEQRHAARMVEIFGSSDRYLAYLSAKNL